MSSIHRMRITADPSVSAATYADLSTDTVWVLGDSLDLGDPDTSFDAAGFPIEGSREVGMSVRVKGTGADAGIVMQQIARAISVPRRWLMIQRTPSTDPVWYRLHPRSPGSLDMGSAWVDRKDGWWTWALRLTVDSTAVGERRTIPRAGTSEVTSTVPNSGTALGVVLDAPGEAPCPLRVDVKPSATTNGKRVLVASYSVPWDSPIIAGGNPSIVMEDDAFALITANATRVTGAAYLSGGGGISMPMDTTGYRVWAFSDGVGASTGQVLEPGRYLVLARLYRSGSTGEAEVRMGERWGGTHTWQPWRMWRPTAGGERSSWVPLGYLQHPFGQDGEGLDPADLMPSGMNIAARCTTTSSAAMILDQVAFVPVDLARGTCEVASFHAYRDGIGAGGDNTFRFDSEYRRSSVIDAFGKAHAVPAPLRTGGWPVAVPGMATGVSVFLDTSDAPSGIDSVSTTSTVTVSTAPRQLHVGQER